MFPQLKTRSERFGVPTRVVRPLGIAAVAVAAAVTIAGCKPGSFSTSSGTGSSLGTTTSSSSVAQVLTLAAQQTQQMNTFSANVQITATGATSANLLGTMNEVATTPSTPTISIVANAGQLGNVKIILSNGMAYMRSPLFTNMYQHPWIEGTMSSLSSSSGLNFGPLLALLEGSSPLMQTQLFPYGTNMRYMGSSILGGHRMREYGGHYILSDILSHLSSSMQPTVQSWMNDGLSMTRFRAWMNSANQVQKLVLIETVNGTTFTITISLNSFNQPMHIAMPAVTNIFVLNGTGSTGSTGTTTGSTGTTTTPTPVSTVPATGTSGTTPTTTPSSMPTHW